MKDIGNLQYKPPTARY